MTVKKEIGGSETPSISVVIVDSRSNEHPEWVQQAIDSIKNQTIQDIELIVLDNTQKLFTIGRMYNQGLQQATADWVFFLGDDDYLSKDYLASLVSFIEDMSEDTVIVSTYSIFFDEEKQERAIKSNSPMGAYRREYFLEHPFREYITKYIDVNAVEDAVKDNKKMITCPWHFGYFYRQHNNQISGRKVVGNND